MVDHARVSVVAALGAARSMQVAARSVDYWVGLFDDLVEGAVVRPVRITVDWVQGPERYSIESPPDASVLEVAVTVSRPPARTSDGVLGTLLLRAVLRVLVEAGERYPVEPPIGLVDPVDMDRFEGAPLSVEELWEGDSPGGNENLILLGLDTNPHNRNPFDGHSADRAILASLETARAGAEFDLSREGAFIKWVVTLARRD
ncbi:MAG: hypothetical protein H7Y15_16180 [Pseudonocardia sp.]|nr:hypothetical protein [Pseudonocardia sp.]